MVAWHTIPGLMREWEALAELKAQTAAEVPARMVRPDVRQAAETWTAATAISLGLKTVPAIRWLPLQADVRGRVDPADMGTIWVKPQDPAEVVDTVAHEVRHLWQLQGDAFRWAQKGLDTHEGREQDAHEYGLSVKAAYLEGRPLPQNGRQPVAAPRPAAVAAQRYQPAPERKAAYRECPQCWEDVPVPGSHRCPVAAAYTGRASW